MDLGYLILPFVTWLVAGGIKFVFNSVTSGNLAFGLIGYGGFPSNHSAIVSSVVALIAIREGVGHPAFGAALALAFIVVLDASSLRRQVGKHAAAINRLAGKNSSYSMLRERMGHTASEIVGGIVVGIVVAFVLDSVFR